MVYQRKFPNLEHVGKGIDLMQMDPFSKKNEASS